MPTSPPILMELSNGFFGSTALASVVPMALNVLVCCTTPFTLAGARLIVASQRFAISNVGVCASKITSPEKIDCLSYSKIYMKLCICYIKSCVKDKIFFFIPW